MSLWVRNGWRADQVTEVLDVELKNVLNIGLAEIKVHRGNMNRIRFYGCPVCGNVITTTDKAEVSCCGSQLEAM